MFFSNILKPLKESFSTRKQIINMHICFQLKLILYWGVIQGGVTFPTLFTIYSLNCKMYVKSDVFMFSDDIVLTPVLDFKIISNYRIT